MRRYYLHTRNMAFFTWSLSQIVTSSWGGRRKLPFAFTEHGVVMFIEKNDKRVNDIIIALNNLIEHPRESKKIGFNAGN